MTRTRSLIGAPRRQSISKLLAIALLLSCELLAAQEKPQLTIEEDCSAFSIAPDGRIAYAVRRVMHQGRWDVQRDDIWISTLEGKRTRIVNGEKLVKSALPFSYSVESLRWSPDSKRLTVQMETIEVTDTHGTTNEQTVTDLMGDDGKEIEIAGTRNSVIRDTEDATWLADGVTVAYLAEAVKPKLLSAIGTVRPAGGRGGTIFDGHYFSAVAWLPKQNAALAIERDRNLSGPIQLVRLDLLKENWQGVTLLDGYLGQFSVSPSGQRVAYFRDGETLEIRDLSAPEKAVRVRAVYGHYVWAPDERRVLLKRGPEKKSGDLVWVSIPDGDFSPILHDLTFRDFQISPDGRWLAVTQPGKRNLLLYPVP